MSRNFELMTQLGLQVGVTDKPKPDATLIMLPRSTLSPLLLAKPSMSGEEEMARFILEMFPRGGSGPKK